MAEPANESWTIFSRQAASREHAVARFEEAWQRGQTPVIDDYLTGEDEQRRLLLVELIHADLECRLKSGEAARVEEYLERYPDLTSDDGCVVSLIETEYQLRGRRESALGIDEYVARFPVYRVQLQALESVAAVRDGSADIGHVLEDGTTDPTALDTPGGRATGQLVREEAETPAHIGRYRVSEVIGRGGFGLVYLAHDDELDRPVAIKVPHANRVADLQDTARYMAEARTAARLEHPHVVPVYDVGSSADIPCYIVSKYIAGKNLHQHVRSAPHSHGHAAEWIAALADALHHAHRRGVVHRDVKPANILVDDTGKVFLVDFGLALREEDFGKHGRDAGTPAYMSPEQVRGEGHRVDGRSDIFSLGIVFYELLAGRHPFRSGTRAQWLEQIVSLDPRPPRQIDDRIPQELERICLKALSKRATDRYTTAKDMADDLRQFLAECHISALQAMRARPTGAVGVGRAAVGSSGTHGADSATVKIVPKGLRSFDEHDADFFLELLPGPRDRQGLPESIRFWKTRIEETDAERTFPVGLLYGPSGCGKSSLVKAGLLPHLGDRICRVFVEAVPHDTESRLLSGVRRACPDVPRGLSLQETLSALRRGQGISDGGKVLVVLDQFEQWLQAQSGQSACELAAALRQCDGGRLQTVLMVRDDFWVPATRLMQELEVRVVEGHNAALIDLFDPLHARKVLTEFGKAYGRLPADPSQWTRELDEFLDAAVQGLSQDGRIICVRLALFADMLKGKPWTMATLAHVGGAEGLGLAFLEETFSSPTAPAAHRYHQQAAQAVLKTLLPQTGTSIRGNRQPAEVLLAASGYSQRPSEFADLIAILDKEVRLITPTVQEGEDVDSASGLQPPASRVQYFQLTHDYLVPSLHDWLTRKQRETRRGRAELQLAERAALWNAKPANRYLPSLFEFVAFRAWTTRRNWTGLQQRMMKQARRVHGRHAVIAVFVTLLLIWLGFESYGRVQARNVLTSDPVALSRVMRQLSPWQLWAKRYLWSIAERVPDSEDELHEQLHARLAYAHLTGRYDPELNSALYTCDIPCLGVVRDVLQPQCDQLMTSLWETLRNAGEPVEMRFRAGVALAAYATGSDQWSADDCTLLAEQLVAENPIHQEQLCRDLLPVSPKLIPDLERLFADRELPESHQMGAANALAMYAKQDKRLLARLLTTATAGQYEILYPHVSSWNDGTAKAEFAEVVARQPADGLSQQACVALGRGRAGAAISLLRLGDAERCRDVFKIRDDPESLTQFVHGCRERNVRAKDLVDSLNDATDVHSRFALLLALGDYPLAEVDSSRRDALIKGLTEAYRSDPSSAIHGATGWLLRRWGFAAEVTKVDHTPLPYDETGTRQWYVLEVSPKPDGTMNWLSAVLAEDGVADKKIYFTFVVFTPGAFMMGSPDTYADHDVDERLHRVTLTRPLAVSTQEVTWEQFMAFDGTARHRASERQFGRSIATAEAASCMTWFKAVEYCRWLTVQAGWSAADQCYDDPRSLAKDANGNPQQWPVHLDRLGFRLPTEAEWECVCRAGMRTEYSFGNDPSLLDHYAWYQDNSSKWSHSGGQLRPTLRGLFDVHGNLYEWCHDWNRTGPIMSNDVVEDVVDPTGPAEGADRVIRGGSWSNVARRCRSASRSWQQPIAPVNLVGFRLVAVPSAGPASPASALESSDR